MFEAVNNTYGISFYDDKKEVWFFRKAKNNKNFSFDSMVRLVNKTNRAVTSKKRKDHFKTTVVCVVLCLASFYCSGTFVTLLKVLFCTLRY